ncbi:MAG TPA: phosphoribosyl-ATP diphosphatase, partial [Bacillota bacterium]
VVTHAGRQPTGREAVAWCQEGVRLGAGEILLTSIDQDGTRAGYDLELIRAVSAAVSVPVIASGGAGSPEHLAQALLAGADAVLAASIFHEGDWTVGRVKRYLRRSGCPVRIDPRDTDWLAEVRWNEAGLVPVVVEAADGVRMLGYANRAALERMLETGYLWLYSRSRGRLWQKGETSGHRQRVLAIALDCDGDALRVRVAPEGPTCHTGADSCFFDEVWRADGEGAGTGEEGPAAGARLGAVVERLAAVIDDRLARRPEGSWVARLAADPDLARRKVGEEALELILASHALERMALGAAESADAAALRQAAVHEAADLLFHWLALVRIAGLDPAEIARELERRHKPSGGNTGVWSARAEAQ